RDGGRMNLGRLGAWLGSERGQRTAALAAGIILVTAVASFGSNPKHEASGTVGSGATGGTTPGTGPISGASAPGSSTSTGTGRARSGATGVNGTSTAGGGGTSAAIPPALRGVDFGLVTQGVTAKTVKIGLSGNFDNCGDTASLV